MKTRFFTAAAIALLAFTSCTPDDSSLTAEGPLPSKIVTTYTGGQVSTSTFTYSGNKILQEDILPAEDVSRRKYTYTGDNITKIEGFMGSTFDAFGGTDLTYENGKVKTITSIAVAGYSGDLMKETYTYNTDGTITVATSYINQATKVEKASGRKMRYTYTNGMLTKSESLSGDVVGQVTNYTNDSGKNQAFKNVLGFDQTMAPGNLRLSATYVGNSNNGETFTYSYNSANYPTKVVITNTYDPQSKTQVFTY